MSTYFNKKEDYDLNSIKKIIEKENLHSIQLKFIDLKGGLRRVTISTSEFNEKLLKLGIGFDGSFHRFQIRYIYKVSCDIELRKIVFHKSKGSSIGRYRAHNMISGIA